MKLEKMSRKSFLEYRKEALGRIADEYAGSGYYSEEEAGRLAEEFFSEMLPQGLDTSGQHLFEIVEKGKPIGIIWYTEANGNGYIQDFLIKEVDRNKGYEKEAVKLLEEDARRRGIKNFEVAAYSHTPKLALFAGLGYQPYYMRLSKSLS